MFSFLKNTQALKIEVRRAGLVICVGNNFFYFFSLNPFIMSYDV
jgi:hypothetical protein